MNTQVEEPQESRCAWMPLDPTVWASWEAKGLAGDRRSGAAHLKGLQWISIATLFAAAALGPQVIDPYDVVARFIVVFSAFVLLLNAVQTKRYSYAGQFVGLVLPYNPIVPAGVAGLKDGPKCLI